ncbi:uncharacterized protein LOC136091543 [Hydra vulgaris]|uniref:Uncharacterized protein LOC136091543 n=1 Tax=Hydra vulgaris TaxID=6087 RepID=A0ABM4DL78_HYDVU
MKISDVHNRIRHDQLNPSDKLFSLSVEAILVTMNLGSTGCAAFLKVYQKKWKDAKRGNIKFESKNKNWLAQDFKSTYSNNISKPDNSSQLHKIGGRPSCSFKVASDKTKRRRLNDIINNFSSDELLHSARLKIRNEYNDEAAKQVAEISEPSSQFKKYTPDEGLALIIDGGMSKSTYQLMRNGAEERDCHIYPSYNNIRLSKAKCYPENIFVDDYSAHVPLQELLKHTVKRLCEVQAPVISTMLDGLTRLTLRCKAGFDGATGQSMYKQISSEEAGDRNLKKEESLFITCLAPLELSGFCNNKKVLLWRNEKPSSTAYCRPIRFSFQNESKAVVIEEAKYLESEIKKCGVFNFTFNGKELVVKSIIELTMIDGKIQTILSHVTNSTQCCSVCGVSPKNMNNLEMVLKLDNSNNLELKYGLSSLHAWIRFFEMVLHIGYKLETQKWQSRAIEDKENVMQVKKRIQTEFMNQMGLVVDFPKSGGSGTSNDGNTARRAFANYQSTAKILKVDETLLFYFYIILVTLSSGFEIDTVKFKEFCITALKLYISKYSWYYMAQSVHKILVHGHAIIARQYLPIGLMSEEAQEACNKDFKKFWEDFSRKTSRIDTNRDLVNRLLVSSDPVITSLRKCHKKMVRV